MTYHRVDSKFWTDEKSANWNDDTKLLALYLKTGPHATLEGFYHLPKGYILADLQWLPERLAEPFAVLLAEGFIRYDETVSVVLIHNALKYQSPDNPNQVKSAITKVADLPETPLLRDFQRLAERFNQRLAEGLAERFGKQRTPTPLPTPSPDKKDAREADDCGNVENPESAQVQGPEPGA
ncbi:MAG: hypothetical protein ACYC99_08940 [Candidatus Geothermincolia bacterium]